MILAASAGVIRAKDRKRESVRASVGKRGREREQASERGRKREFESERRRERGERGVERAGEKGERERANQFKQEH